MFWFSFMFSLLCSSGVNPLSAWISLDTVAAAAGRGLCHPRSTTAATALLYEHMAT